MIRNIEAVASVNVDDLIDILETTPDLEWPKAETAEKFRGFSEWLVAEYFTAWKLGGYGIFVLDPGQMHVAHRDIQPEEWIIRVHVPILTNPYAIAVTDQGALHMECGTVYRFDTREMHAVANCGSTPRAHLIIDVLRKK